MYLSVQISRIIAFIRAGYPKGMPSTGYVPLAALFRRRLCEDEAEIIASKLAAYRRRISVVDVGVEITRITDEMPLPADISRVQQRVALIRCAPGHHD